MLKIITNNLRDFEKLLSPSENDNINELSNSSEDHNYSDPKVNDTQLIADTFNSDSDNS